MIYLVDKGFRIKSALYNVNNQFKCPGMYDECLCLGCNVKDEVKIEVEDKVEIDVDDNVNQGTDGVRGTSNCLEDQRQSPFADSKANDSINDNVNQGTCFAHANINDSVNANIDANDNVNQGPCLQDQRPISFADVNANANLPRLMGTCLADVNVNQ